MVELYQDRQKKTVNDSLISKILDAFYGQNCSNIDSFYFDCVQSYSTVEVQTVTLKKGDALGGYCNKNLLLF